MTLPEYSIVVVTRDLPEQDLMAGDVGTIVLTHVDKDGQPIGYEIEVFSITGQSVTTIGVHLSDVRIANENDRVHARSAA
jgi:Domain of unknown function (DUF4926)